jgi:hypothetical protein
MAPGAYVAGVHESLIVPHDGVVNPGKACRGDALTQRKGMDRINRIYMISINADRVVFWSIRLIM